MLQTEIDKSVTAAGDPKTHKAKPAELKGGRQNSDHWQSKLEVRKDSKPSALGNLVRMKF